MPGRQTIAEANAPLDRNVAIIAKKKGLKMAHIAAEAGLSAQELSDMINGRRLIKARDIPKLAYALKVTSDELFRYPEELTKDNTSK